jgi:hypothetical protein
MLEIFIFHVNEHRDTRKIQKTPFDLLSNIASLCQKSGSFIQINSDLNLIIELLGKLQKLKSDSL